MQLTNLDQIQDQYDHVYLSPHLDDAVLSCGGAIATSRAAGARVLVVTLCTAAPSPEGPFSDLAQEFHRYWGLAPSEVVAARLAEDRLAMEQIGADFYWAGMLDAIYRYPQAYTSRASLFATPAADDPLQDLLRSFLTALRVRVPHATLYAPLGIGQHVDHLLTYAAAVEYDPSIACYEDTPYVTKPGALDRRLAVLAPGLESRTIEIAAGLPQKIRGIEAYASQLNELFGSPEAMARTISEYAQSAAADGQSRAERLWFRPAGS